MQYHKLFEVYGTYTYSNIYYIDNVIPNIYKLDIDLENGCGSGSVFRIAFFSLKQF